MPNTEWNEALSGPVHRPFEPPAASSAPTAVMTAPAQAAPTPRSAARTSALKRIALVVAVLVIAIAGWVQRETITERTQDGYDWVADRLANDP